jgi:hypothetical protein
VPRKNDTRSATTESERRKLDAKEKRKAVFDETKDYSPRTEKNTHEIKHSALRGVKWFRDSWDGSDFVPRETTGKRQRPLEDHHAGQGSLVTNGIPDALKRVKDDLPPNQERQKFAIEVVSWLDILLKDNKYSQDELKKRTVLEEAVKQNLVCEFRAALQTLDIPEADIPKFFDTIRDAFLPAGIEEGPNINVPSKAPELYAERTDKSEKPEAFLVRVYEDLTGTPERPAKITRSHIKAWDKNLYDALYKRRKLIANFDILLPKAQGRSLDDLSRSDTEILQGYRDRSAQMMRRHRRNQ